MRRALIMAGGTGGHVFPALALAEGLRTQGWQVVWLGTAQGMESVWVKKHQFPLEFLRMGGVRGKGWKRACLSPLMLTWATVQAMVVLMRQRPQVVVGFGGYVALPGGLASVLLKLPLMIHEQNAVAGLTNRLLARLATVVLEGFPHSFRQPSAHPLVRWLGYPKKVHAVGNPVRHSLLHLAPARLRFLTRSGRLTLLVLGGSQGAQALNQWIPKALALMPSTERPWVVHQGGGKNLVQLQQQYQQAGVEGDLRAFIDDMAAVYAQADLVICRAGALTLAELTAVGLGSVLVPFPAAVDDHQTRNARVLEEAGAAKLWPQDQSDPQQLADWLRQQSREGLLAMAEAAHGLFNDRTIPAMVAFCEELAA